MPITLTNEPLNTGYLNVFNPAVFEFNSDQSETSATIQIQGRESVAKIDADEVGTFYFDAQEWLRAFFDFDFTDAMEASEDNVNESSFTDNNLFREVTLTFRVGSDVLIKSYRLFLASLPIGTTPATLGQRLTLSLTNKLPVVVGDYQELAVYATQLISFRGTALSPGYNRLRVKSQEDINRLNNNLGVELVPYQADGIRIKYFSSAGCWIYLRSQCPYRINTEVSTGDVVPTTRRNIQRERSTFRILRKTTRKTYLLPFETQHQAYIDDLLSSLGVYISVNEQWIGAQVNTATHTADSNDNYSRIILSLSYQERDPQTQI